MGRIIIEYLPDISEEAEKIISENITPAMTSYEGDSNQYNLLDILADIISMFSKEDQDVLKKLKSEGVDYIEL
jgi:hypothetical protein